MGAKAVDHPLVTAWLDHYGRDDTIRQYAPFVRGLLRRCEKLPADIGSTELIAYVLAEASIARRKKAISAFGSFFRFVADTANSANDVARDLTERVERAAQKREMAEALRRAGMSINEISDLSWRDVVAGVLVGPNPTINGALIAKDAATARLLSEKLLERLRSADIESMAVILRAPVFGPD